MTKGQAQITSLKGKVSAVCPGRKGAVDLARYDFIKPGCEVSTGADSRLEMVCRIEAWCVWLKRQSSNWFRRIQGAGGRRAVGISMTLGKIWSNVRKSLAGRGDKFEISCQNAVAGVRGTVYRMDIEVDQSAVVKVYDGEVSVAGVSQNNSRPFTAVGPPKPVSGPSVIEGPKPVSMEQWVYLVKSMQQIQITADGRALEPKDFTEAEDMDDWVKWNKQRDKKYGE